MKLWLLFTLFCLNCLTLQADPIRGYIVTKDGKQLLGYLGDIYYSTASSSVLFINDFGDVYEIEAQLIKGFVRFNKAEHDVYKSKYINRRWAYLKVITKMEGLSLYQAPKEVTLELFSGRVVESRQRQMTQYWIEQNDQRPTQLSRFNYKRKLKKLLGSQVPDIIPLIGTSNYQYRNIANIIKTYREMLADQQKPRT